MRAGNCCRFIFGIMCVGAGGYLIWHFVGRPTAISDLDLDFDFGDFTDVIANITDKVFGDLWDKDPFVGDNSTSAWENDGKGLSLELLDALDDAWQTEFSLAVSDWENGDPDTVTFSVSKGQVDHSCKVVNGLMKVCNGNYGDTGWLGINEMILGSGRTIRSSVAKMNEFYLYNADMDKRRYTMCHEIGHGLGLPHTDEQFDNRDLGNCLDYTQNPSANLLPGAVNYNRLREIYGTVGGRRKLRTQPSKTAKQQQFSRDLMEKYDSAIQELEAIIKNQHHGESGWRRLTEHEHGHYSLPLDDEHTLMVQMLYAETS